MIFGGSTCANAVIDGSSAKALSTDEGAANVGTEESKAGAGAVEDGTVPTVVTVEGKTMLTVLPAGIAPS